MSGQKHNDGTERQHGQPGVLAVIEAPSEAQAGRSSSVSHFSYVEGYWEEQKATLFWLL